MEPLTPDEAIELIDKKKNGNGNDNGNGNGNGNGNSKAEKEAQLLGSTKEAIALRRAEIEGEIKLNKAKWRAAENYCANRQMKFKILTEKELGIK